MMSFLKPPTEKIFLQVLRNLQQALLERHLPAFQRCVARGEGGGGRGGQGLGKGRGQGQGRGQGGGRRGQA